VAGPQAPLIGPASSKVAIASLTAEFIDTSGLNGLLMGWD
jgi:hypothetical protein